jgi:hypothetical protein
VSVGKGPANPHAVDEATRAVVAASVEPAAWLAPGTSSTETTVGLNALLERKGPASACPPPRAFAARRLYWHAYSG